MPAYVPAPFRRYLGVGNDPTTGGSNLDTIQGNANLGITADTADFPSATIADLTTTWPVKTATGAWGKSNINFDDLVTGTRAGPAELPYKSMPTFSVTFDAHRYIVEKVMKYAMGVEGTLTPAVYEVDSSSLVGASAGTFNYAFSWNGITYTTVTSTAYQRVERDVSGEPAGGEGPAGPDASGGDDRGVGRPSAGGHDDHVLGRRWRARSRISGDCGGCPDGCDGREHAHDPGHRARASALG